MKIYISGPMKDMPEHNFPLFNATAATLRDLGYAVVNPAEINPGPHPDEFADPTAWRDYYHKCLRADIRELTDCDVLVLLPGWEVSSGANLELHLAHRLGIRPFIYNDFLLDHYRRQGSVV